MATINKNLENLSKADILVVSERYLMGWHDLEKPYGFRVKGLNKKRAELGMELLDKEKSFEYRINYIKSHYTDDEIRKAIIAVLQNSRVADERWNDGIRLLDCRFGREYARAFRELIGSADYRRLSESCRVQKLEETQRDLYGGIGLAGQSSKEKARQTNLQKYGVANVMQNDDVKSRLSEVNTVKYGGMSPFNSDVVRQKALATRLENVRQQMDQFAKDGIISNVNCFMSLGEQIVFIALVNRFGRQDVLYQYGVHPADKRYPFSCDFYIKSLDLFIEINAHYSHGGHWFDDTNHDDALRRTHMLQSGKKRTINAAKVWCDTDVQRRNYARKNQLNYLVFWDGTSRKGIPNLKDFYLWFENYDCDTKAFLLDYPGNTY